MNDEQAPTAGDAQPDSVFNTHGVPRNPSTRFSGALPVEADPPRRTFRTRSTERLSRMTDLRAMGWSTTFSLRHWRRGREHRFNDHGRRRSSTSTRRVSRPATCWHLRIHLLQQGRHTSVRLRRGRAAIPSAATALNGPRHRTTTVDAGPPGTRRRELPAEVQPVPHEAFVGLLEQIWRQISLERR